MSFIIIVPTGGRSYTTESEVIEGWASNHDFMTPFEKTSYIRRTDFENYGNQLDGIKFVKGDLEVTIKEAII